ncbi:MAG: hypothetical protein ABI857_07365 [Acidobacteriota bacterium]
MKSVVIGHWSLVSFFGRLSCLLLVACCLLACSLPNLEEADCTQARDIVREFYSFHFANDMHPTQENIRLREKYLTHDYATKLMHGEASVTPATKDLFTDSEDFPKAFRVGECKVVEAGQNVQFKVLMFWKDDEKSQQKPVVAFVRKENDKWLIDSVSPLDK